MGGSSPFHRERAGLFLLEHIRNILADLVAGTVAADDDVSHEGASQGYDLGEYSVIWRMLCVGGEKASSFGAYLGPVHAAPKFVMPGLDPGIHDFTAS